MSLTNRIRAFQQEQNVFRSMEVASMKKVVDRRKEVERTLSPKTGRARYSETLPRYGLVHHCIQMVDMLPWWRRLLVPFVGQYCEIGGVKYLKVGETNIFYRAQEWIAGRAKKSTLLVV